MCFSVLNVTGDYAGLPKIMQNSLRILGANPADAKQEKKEGTQNEEYNKCTMYKCTLF